MPNKTSDVILKEVADIERKKLTGLNRHNENNKYSATHKDALSDGDELGRGEVNGAIGTSVDQAEVKKQLALNIFSSANPYKTPK